MDGDSHSWMRKDGRPNWSPEWSLQALRPRELLPWATTGSEYQALVDKYVNETSFDINRQMDAWRQARKREMSPLRTWKPGSRDSAAWAAQALRDSEPIRAWWLANTRRTAEILAKWGEHRMSPAPPPEHIPGTEPSKSDRERLAPWGRLQAQFAARLESPSHSREKSSTGSAFIFEAVPGPARVVFVAHQPRTEPDMTNAREFRFPAFLGGPLITYFGSHPLLSFAEDAPLGRRLEVLPTNPKTGKPLKVPKEEKALELNFLAHYHVVAVPQS
jgi:hypothetical protein